MLRQLQLMFACCLVAAGGLCDGAGIRTLSEAAGSISSSSSCGKVDECWLLETNDTVSVRFAELDMDAAGGHRVELHARSTSAAGDGLRFAVRDASSLTSEFLIPGPALLRFVGNAGRGGRSSFSLSYAVATDSVSMATEVIRAEGVVERSSHPQFGAGNYSDDYAISFVFAGNAGGSARLRFSDFDTEAPNDAATVSAGSEKILQHAGSSDGLPPGGVAVSGAAAVEFRSDSNGATGRGFVVRFLPADTETLPGSAGSFSFLSSSQTVGNKKWLIDTNSTVRVRMAVTVIRHFALSVPLMPRMEMYDRSTAVAAGPPRFVPNFLHDQMVEFRLRGPVLLRCLRRPVMNDTEVRLNVSYAVDSAVAERSAPARLVADVPLAVLGFDRTLCDEKQQSSAPCCGCGSQCRRAWIIPVSEKQILKVRFGSSRYKVSPGDTVKVFSGMDAAGGSSSPIHVQQAQVSGAKVFTDTVTVVYESDGTSVARTYFIDAFRIDVLDAAAGSVSNKLHPVTAECVGGALLINSSNDLVVSFSQLQAESLRFYRVDSSLSSSGSKLLEAQDPTVDSEFWVTGPVLVEFARERACFDMSYAVLADDSSSNFTMPTEVIRKARGTRSRIALDGEVAEADAAWAIVAPRGHCVRLRLKFRKPAPLSSLKVFAGMEPDLVSSSAIFERPAISERDAVEMSHNGTVTVVHRAVSAGHEIDFGLDFEVQPIP